MEGIPEIGNTTITFQSPMYCDSYVRLLDEDENMPKTPYSEYTSLDHPIENKEQHTRKITQKKREVDETRDNNGPSVTVCFSILKRFLNFKDSLYFIATNVLCKEKSIHKYGCRWIAMKNDLDG
ncbi:hypothetical protein ACOSQ4_010614 [Xanthoceras sorbifolium]